MKQLNKIKGNIGEEVATNFLKKKNYKILERNFKTVFGEVDIIARVKKTIVFVEVKSRMSREFGLPCEAVDFRKQSKIRKVAQYFLMKDEFKEFDVRFDVIEVIDDEINHIENAF